MSERVMSPTAMRTFRTEVEAWQYDGNNHEEIVAWVNDGGGKAEFLPYQPAVRNSLGLVTEGAFPACIEVLTGGGPEYLDEGDWVIKNAIGEFRTCTKDAFSELYEEVGK